MTSQAIKERPFLADALTPQLVETQLRNLGVNDKVTECRLERYKVGKRCLISYHLPSGVLLGKVRFKGTDTRTDRLQRELYQGNFGAKASEGIRVAEPLGLITEWRMTLQHKAAGIPAQRIFAGSNKRVQEHLAERIAFAAAKLHQSELLPERSYTIIDELQILQSQLQTVMDHNPAWRTAILQRLNDAQKLAESATAQTQGLVHRDFYAEHIIYHGEQLTLIDLDTLTLADPALDIGNFVAHLKEQALREKGDIKALVDAETILVDRYLTLQPQVARRSIQIYTALSLLRHVAISQRIPERKHLSSNLLGACAKIFRQLL